MKPWPLLVCLLALAASLPMGSATVGGGTFVDDGGRLLVGTAGVGVGDPTAPLPDQIEGSGPVSHALHRFTVPACPHFLGVQGQARTLDTDPGTWEGIGLFDPALIRLEVEAPDGTTVESEFGNDPAFATESAVPPGSYELHVFHLVGGPIAYDVLVEGAPAPSCG